ncbi:ethionine resistance protein [Coemansia thaxteri]|uniref:Ethionine resistance protein n=1 Tax=Coemansia thaxteri TaxID=2663907 RepID=A0A9W8BMU6_9FUNG|nr:ethionine resistance protein [Coemansia thaxteri]
MPLIGSYYLHYLLGFLNLISLGTWGGKAIGAYALGNMTCAILVFAPATGVASALDTLCAASFAHFGSGNEAGLYLQQGLVVVTTWYSAVLVVMQFGISSIYMLLGQQEDLAQPAAEYLRILSLGLWPWMAFECFKRYTQANTQMRLPAMVLAAVVPLHLLNHWFFVWRRGDDAVFTTVAWITVISYWAMFLGLAACTLICEELRPVWRVPALKRLVSAKFLSLALPAMAEACGEYMSFEIMTLIATYLGPTSLAAQAIAFNSMSMVYQLPHGVGGAAAVRIGRLLGQSSGEKAKFLARILVASGLGYGLLGMILFAAFGSRWVALYTRDEEVLAVARQLVGIVVVIEWADATRGIVPGILRGMGRQRQAAVINIASYYFVVLPLAIVAVFGLGRGIVGLWAAFALGMSILSGLYIAVVSTTNWDKEVELCARRIAAHV